MFLSTPLNPSPYDLNFSALGIPVRVTPWFWVAAVLLGWSYTGIADALELNRVVVLAMWTAALLFSIFVHEMGHALAFRYYGIRSHVVLYHFGGLAIPIGDDFSGGYRVRGTWHQVHISAAGPGAQFLLAGVVILAVVLYGYSIRVPLFMQVLTFGTGPMISNPTLHLAIWFILIPSIYWALFNLLPIIPLDGGQISRELFRMADPLGGYVKSLILSLLVSGGLGIFSYLTGNVFNAMFCISMALGNYQELQSFWGGGYGRGRW